MKLEYIDYPDQRLPVVQTFETAKGYSGRNSRSEACHESADADGND